MIRKTIVITLLLVIAVGLPSGYAIISFDQFCDKKITDKNTSAADYLCSFHITKESSEHKFTVGNGLLLQDQTQYINASCPEGTKIDHYPGMSSGFKIVYNNAEPKFYGLDREFTTARFSVDNVKEDSYIGITAACLGISP